MAIQREIWTRDIAENLYPKNSFMDFSMTDDDIEGTTVHTHEAGVASNIEEDRTELPAPIKKRTDVAGTYEIQEFTSDPILIQKTEEVELSYNKRQSVISNDTMNMRTRIANNLAYRWAPSLAANIIRTSGANRTATAPGATGTRKSVAKADIISLRELFDGWDIDDEGRIVLIPSSMYADILAIDDFVHANKIGSANIVKGSIGMLYNFNVMMRSRGPVYDNSGTPAAKHPTATAATTDNLSCLAWHPNFVRKANSEIEMFDNPAQAAYYGDIMSFLVRSGGKKRYSDEKGVAAIVQAAGA